MVYLPINALTLASSSFTSTPWTMQARSTALRGGAAQAVHTNAHEDRGGLGGYLENIADNGIFGNVHSTIPPFMVGMEIV